MDYLEWAEEYLADALRIRNVIEKKKELLNDKNLSHDDKKTISDTIIAYRCIYREMLKTAEILRGRAGVSHET